MLNFSTLWVIYLGNFVGTGLVWVYVARSYPNFGAARFWCAGSFVVAAGAGISLLRGVVDPLVPILFGNGVMVLASCLCVMGVQRFYDRPVAWRASALIVGGTLTGLAFFAVGRDDMPARIVVYSLAQSIPLLLALPLLLSRRIGRGGPGARMAGYLALVMIALYVIRSVACLLRVDGEVTFVDFNVLQAVLIAVLMFMAMAWNFSFLLMAIDRLRGEVAALALVDDLTGVANRRHLLQRLTEQCALSLRTQKPFALLAIDLDGFKLINDSYGHAAGDECLRRFTRAAQSRLRPGDMLARAGGDEFCIVLPSTGLHEGAVIARRILEACRDAAAACAPGDIPVAASIGVAQWQPSIGNYPERLIAAADQALYAAKHDGKNRYAVCDHAPPLVPTFEEALAPMRTVA
jgi:diguanylate cyclase (GGDEF)-like protein